MQKIEKGFGRRLDEMESKKAVDDVQCSTVDVRATQATATSKAAPAPAQKKGGGAASKPLSAYVIKVYDGHNDLLFVSAPHLHFLVLAFSSTHEPPKRLSIRPRSHHLTSWTTHSSAMR